MLYFIQKYGDVEAVYMEFEPNSGPPTPMPDFDELFPPARDPYATGNGFKVNVFMSFG